MCHLVLQLLCQPKPAGGTGLAVENGEIDAAAVQVRDDDRCGGDVQILQLREVGVHPRAERTPYLVAGASVVAVDQDLQGRVGHKGDATTVTVPMTPGSANRGLTSSSVQVADSLA